jgi:hypothetical protein
VRVASLRGPDTETSHSTGEQELALTLRRDCWDELFREVNDRIMELGQQLGVEEDLLELICECEDSTCTDRVEISAVEFARFRGVDGVHLVAPGHIPRGRVVGRGDGYLVVADD